MWRKIFITLGGLLLVVVSRIVYYLGNLDAGENGDFFIRGIYCGVRLLFIFFLPIALVALAVCWKRRIYPRYETCLILVLCIIIGALLEEVMIVGHDFCYVKSILDIEGISVFWDK
jgi:hypothetical protein